MVVGGHGGSDGGCEYLSSAYSIIGRILYAFVAFITSWKLCQIHSPVQLTMAYSVHLPQYTHILCYSHSILWRWWRRKDAWLIFGDGTTRGGITDANDDSGVCVAPSKCCVVVVVATANPASDVIYEPGRIRHLAILAARSLSVPMPR